MAMVHSRPVKYQIDNNLGVMSKNTTHLAVRSVTNKCSGLRL